MTGSTVARSYAETVFALGERHGQQAGFAAAFDEVARVLAEEPRVARFLESPLVELEAKKQVLSRALGGRVPGAFERFLGIVLKKRRAKLLGAIAREYRTILDEHAGRVHVDITLAREPDERTEREIATDLSKVLGRTVIPHVQVDPAILGGIVVRYGDRLIDGSLRRRITSLRRRMLTARLPSVVETGVRDPIAAPEVGA